MNTSLLCTPRDIEVLTCHVIQKSRAFLYAHPEYILTTEEQSWLDAAIERRKTGEPIAYIIGKKEFYGREFLVNSATLIPRPETEELVELVKTTIQNHNTKIHDLGTGSGCIAITLASEGYRNISASDISPEALLVAKQNAKAHQQEILFVQADLLQGVSDDIEVLVGNLPYVPLRIKDELTTDVKDFEPHLALFSGVDGSDLYRKLGVQLQSRMDTLQACLFEVDHTHAKDIMQYYQKIVPVFNWKIVRDISGKDRFIVGCR